jgi:hypothetical protein
VLAAAFGGNFSYGLAGVAVAAALMIVVFALVGSEAKDADLALAPGA